jgi:predicted ester cyclase
MSVEENTALIHRIVEAVNRGELDVVDELFAADYVDHSRPGLPPGPAGAKAFFALARAAFPDLSVTIAETIAEGDRVAVRGALRGTHRGDFMGIPPTGTRVTVSLIDINRIAGGKLVERWANQDDLGLLRQLGVLPAPGQ